MKLIFPPYSLTIREDQGQTYVWDIIRKKWIAYLPEEMVRQHLIHFMITEKGVVPGLVAVEKEIRFLGLRKRFDVVVFNREGKPFILCECKAPEVAITRDTLNQIARYNATIQAPHLLLTNGVQLLFFSQDQTGKYLIQKQGWL